MEQQGGDEEFSRPQDVAIRLHRTIRALAKAFCLKELFHVVGREERDLTQGQKRYFGLFIVRASTDPVSAQRIASSPLTGPARHADCSMARRDEAISDGCRYGATFSAAVFGRAF